MHVAASLRQLSQRQLSQKERPMSTSTTSVTSASNLSPEENLDKMIKHQERMFSLEIVKEMNRSEHDMRMSQARAMGDSAQKA